MYRNSESYADSTAERAIKAMEKTERKQEGDINKLITAIKHFASIIGLELIEIKLRDRHSKKEWYIREGLKK